MTVSEEKRACPVPATTKSTRSQRNFGFYNTLKTSVFQYFHRIFETDTDAHKYHIKAKNGDIKGVTLIGDELETDLGKIERFIFMKTRIFLQEKCNCILA